MYWDEDDLPQRPAGKGWFGRLRVWQAKRRKAFWEKKVKEDPNDMYYVGMWKYASLFLQRLEGK